MYAGHVAVALAARRYTRAPLWVLVLAAQGPDWADAALEWLAPGDWRTSAWSPHGLPMVAAGAALCAAAAARATAAGGRARGALLAAACYASHWPCDAVTSRKPTWPGGPLVGLSLYAHPRRDFAVEALVVLAGWLVWRASLARPAGGEPAGTGGPGGAGASGRREALARGLLVALLALQAFADWAFLQQRFVD
jgi:hypothetical protein